MTPPLHAASAALHVHTIPNLLAPPFTIKSDVPTLPQSDTPLVHSISNHPPVCTVCKLPYMMSTNTVRVVRWVCWTCGSWKKSREVKDMTVERQREEDGEEDQR